MRAIVDPAGIWPGAGSGFGGRRLAVGSPQFGAGPLAVGTAAGPCFIPPGTGGFADATFARSTGLALVAQPAIDRASAAAASSTAGPDRFSRLVIGTPS